MVGGSGYGFLTRALSYETATMTKQKVVQYREWAAKVLADAQETEDHEAKQMLLEIARHLDQLAEWAERSPR